MLMRTHHLLCVLLLHPLLQHLLLFHMPRRSRLVEEDPSLDLVRRILIALLQHHFSARRSLFVGPWLLAVVHALLHRRSPAATTHSGVTAAVQLQTVVDDSSTSSSDVSSHHAHSEPTLSQRPSFSSAGGSFTTPAFDLFSASGKQRHSSLATTLVSKLPLLSSCASPQDVCTHSSPPAVTVANGSSSPLVDARADIKHLHDALAASQAKEEAIGQQLGDARSHNLQLLHQALSAHHLTPDTPGASKLNSLLSVSNLSIRRASSPFLSS
jgi:hypothetical protein